VRTFLVYIDRLSSCHVIGYYCYEGSVSDVQHHNVIIDVFITGCDIVLMFPKCHVSLVNWFGPNDELQRLTLQVCSLLAFVCTAIAGGSDWVWFATMSCFIDAIIWFVLNILNVLPGRFYINRYIVSEVIFQMFRLF
jgi:tetrahydromethanopterin S-methyltransferase subunit C